MQTDVGVLGYVRALFSGGVVSGIGDAQLLERFRARGDDEASEHAFAALLHRHGPMVLRACLTVTRDRAEAEDAFQATFLVLARRAHALWIRDSLGPWLHSVAVRVASDARDAVDRRRRHERRYEEMVSTRSLVGANPDHDDEYGDLRALLHEEVARLPRTLRAPIVLCDLEGLTHQQAAGQLGWPLGTLKTRLTGARKRLRGRLIARGVAPAAAVFASVLAAETARCAVVLPAALASATLRAVAALRVVTGVAGTGVVAATVQQLVNGVLRSMMLAKIRQAVVSLAAAGALLGGAYASRALFAAGPPVVDPAAVAATDPPVANGRVMELTIVDGQTRQPVPGAEVRADWDDSATPSPPGSTDPAGHYTVKLLPNAGFLTLRVRARGHVPVRVGWRSSATSGTRSPLALPDSYTVSLERSTSIGGTVQNAQGQPLHDATVFLIVPPGSATEPGVHPRVDIWEEPFKTDNQGRWQCDDVPAGPIKPWLRAEHRDFVSKPVIDDDPKVLASLRNRSHILRLESGLSVTGRVLDRSGEPLSGATVDRGMSLSDFLHERVTTDAAGHFHFDHVAPGSTLVTVRARGHAPALGEVDVGPGLAPLEFRLGPPQTVRGRVVDASGKPVAGTLVVTDSWRDYRTLDLRTETDADGRFSITDLPDEPIAFQFAREGYMNLPGLRLSPAAEATVTLTRPLIVRGRVTDAKTGKPIDRFTLFESLAPDNWDREHPRPSQGGQYEYAANWPYPVKRALRIEAKGYLPAISSEFHSTEGEIRYDFSMTPGDVPARPAVQGVVSLPDGSPAHDAEVALSGKTFAPYISNGKPASPRGWPATRTSRDGTFRFEPQTEPVRIMAFHDRGFAEVDEAELAARPNHTLVLVAWGRVEGTLRIGARPGARQTVRLDPRRVADGRDALAVAHFEYQTQTDDQGRFVFERVLPGPALVSRGLSPSPGSILIDRWYPVDVPPGATALVTLGGMGRPVVGRVIGPRGTQGPFEPRALHSAFQLAPPVVADPRFHDQTLPKERRLAWYQGWIATEEGKNYLAWQQNPRSHGMAVGRDGSFRIEDVIPGTYELTLRLTEPAIPAGNAVAGEARRTVTIAPIPGGRTDTPLDLGTIELVPSH